jgi:RNA polymerase sigma factor (sigma-70 family)
MEASALQAPAGLARARISVSAPLLRLRSDDQLLAQFRAGNDDAFRVIHDRYRQRLFAYTKQMLPGSTQDAEVVLQDVFVRAYSGLRVNRRPLTLRPWLYRVAHNRCVDEIRRPVPPTPEVLHQASAPTHDPAVQAEQRESLQRLIVDLRRLPDQQRSALLMRELSGMSYADVAVAMDVSVPAVKSLLVRARIGLALAVEARDTACVEIRDEITLAHDRRVRPSGTVRRHLADCPGCREFRAEIRGSRRQFAALLPAIGPIGVLGNLLGIGGGGAAGGAAGGGAGAAATGGASATTGAVIGGGTAASAGTLAAGATHVATLIAAAVVTAGGAVAIQSTVTAAHHRHVVPAHAAPASSASPVLAPLSSQSQPYEPQSTPAQAQSTAPEPAAANHASTTTSGADAKSASPTPISGGDNIVPTATPQGAATNSTGTAGAGETPAGTVTPTGTSGTGTSGTGTSTGTSSSTGNSSTAGTGNGATGSTAAGATGSTSSGTGGPTGTTAAAGSTSGTSTDATTTPPTGT